MPPLRLLALALIVVLLAGCHGHREHHHHPCHTACGSTAGEVIVVGTYLLVSVLVRACR